MLLKYTSAVRMFGTVLGPPGGSRGIFYFYDVDSAISSVPIWFSSWLFGLYLLYWESGAMDIQ